MESVSTRKVVPGNGSGKTLMAMNVVPIQTSPMPRRSLCPAHLGACHRSPSSGRACAGSALRRWRATEPLADARIGSRAALRQPGGPHAKLLLPGFRLKGPQCFRHERNLSPPGSGGQTGLERSPRRHPPGGSNALAAENHLCRPRRTCRVPGAQERDEWRVSRERSPKLSTR